jgi:hypothetical protein
MERVNGQRATGFHAQGGFNWARVAVCCSKEPRREPFRRFPEAARRTGDRMRARTLLPALIAGTLISSQAMAVEASGTTVGVNPDAQAAGSQGMRVIKIKGPIFMGDVITTDVKGQVEILFVDDTKFVVGANSKVTIDAFVYDANKTAQDVSISAVKGAFRFITGKSPKDNYSIKTPTMTIGVRGTAFDLAVRSGSGESMVIVHEGATEICDAVHRCVAGNTGSMTVSSRDGLRSVPPGLDRKQRLAAFFPLVKSQHDLPPGFVVNVPGDLSDDQGSDPRHDGTTNPGEKPTNPKPGNPDGRPPH